MSNIFLKFDVDDVSFLVKTCFLASQTRMLLLRSIRYLGNKILLKIGLNLFFPKFELTFRILIAGEIQRNFKFRCRYHHQENENEPTRPYPQLSPTY